MSEHKFVVGQNVQFLPNWPLDKSTGGQYSIVRLYPKAGDSPQYRIKSKRDGHERMVLEDQLDRLLGPVTAKNSFPLTPDGKPLK
jgi:hypothetical protein